MHKAKTMAFPTGILGLSVQLSDDWREPSEGVISPLSDIQG